MPGQTEQAPQGLKRSSRFVFASACCVALLTGCGEDAHETALRDAANILESRHTSTILVTDQSGPKLNNVISSLRGVASDGTKSQQAAANVMIARAQHGLAMPKLASIADLERQAMRLAAEIDNEHDTWNELNAIARAEEVFDPSALLRENQTKVNELNGEIIRVKNEIQQVEKRIAGLEAEAADLTRQAEFEANRYGQMLDEAIHAGPVRALEIKQEAHDVRRRSEGLYADADRTNARADQIRPDIDALQIELSQYEGQRELLEKADDDLRQRRETAVAEANRLRKEAGESASRLSDLMDALVELREESIRPERENLLKVLNDASRAARSARSANADAATLVLAEIVQTTGDVQRLKADSDGLFVTLLERLIASSPALPDRSEYVALLDEVQAGALEAEQEAADAYSEAADLYERSVNRVSNRSAKRRLDSASENLKRLSGTAQDEVTDGEVSQEEQAPSDDEGAEAQNGEEENPGEG